MQWVELINGNNISKWSIIKIQVSLHQLKIISISQLNTTKTCMIKKEKKSSKKYQECQIVHMIGKKFDNITKEI